LHRLGVWHRDIKPANILVCNSEIAKKNRYIRYNYNNEKFWTLSYNNLENRDFKLLDYGESKVVNNNTNPCKTFEYEVNNSFYNIIELMWQNVKDKQNENLYGEFMKSIKNCKTSVNDILLESKIFEELTQKYNKEKAYEVDLLTY